MNAPHWHIDAHALLHLEAAAVVVERDLLSALAVVHSKDRVQAQRLVENLVEVLVLQHILVIYPASRRINQLLVDLLAELLLRSLVIGKL
jgi:hypothetical protein